MDIYYTMATRISILLGIVSLALSIGSSSPNVCDSPIYCHGDLLHRVQMSDLFADSKYFVDLKMKFNSTVILTNFEKLLNYTNSNPSDREVKRFIDIFFEPPGTEFETWTPSDWTEHPSFVKNIADIEYRAWALDLNERWRTLTRKMKLDVQWKPHLYSAIYLPHPFVIPGGRFREVYYWDSYWVIRGLLLSEMTQTVKGMLTNFLSLIERFGMVPNGARIYYTRRSQPPLLIPMFHSYLQATKDYAFLESNIHLLAEEFSFWMKNRITSVTKNGIAYRVAVYKDSTQGPRPESYRTDVIDGSLAKDKEEFYSELKSAAESGWDFSSRWFSSNSAQATRRDIKMKTLVPVDLNSIICWNAKILAEFYMRINDVNKAIQYALIADEWSLMVEEILWDDGYGSWFDYDILKNARRPYFYPSNIAPLWTGCIKTDNGTYFVTKILKYLNDKNIMSFKGGIPTSLFETEEQWDFPNAWPPLQHMVIMGLDKIDLKEAKDLAFGMAEKWILSNFLVYKKTGEMFEKYDIRGEGEAGFGGEYDVQVGFGWTNAVIMELLDKYGNRVNSNCTSSDSHCGKPVVS